MKAGLLGLAAGVAVLMAVGSLTAAEPEGAAAQARGKRIYDNLCIHCHAPGLIGTVTLERRYQGKVPSVLTDRTDLQPAYVQRLLRTQVVGMTAFRPSELSDSDLADIAAYLSRNNAPTRRTP